MIDKFVLYKNEVENQLNKKIRVLRSDRGGEYESPFVDVCANRTLKEMMNAMLISYGILQNI